MIVKAEENHSKAYEVENPFSTTAVQNLGQFLALHFEKLEKFFDLMDRSQGKGNCQMCEFSSMGRFFLRRFKDETEKVRQAIERDFGVIHIARVNTKDDILGVIAVQPAPPAGNPERG